MKEKYCRFSRQSILDIRRYNLKIAVFPVHAENRGSSVPNQF